MAHTPQATSDPEGEETKGLRRLRWADCNDEGRKQQVVLELVGFETKRDEERRAQEARKERERRAQEAREDREREK